jgi:flagellar motility protein MotE (MotC chaperone)
MKFLQSPLFAAVLGAVLFLLTSAFFTTQGLTNVERGTQNAELDQPNLTGPSWEFFNPELDQLLGDLKAEREAVAGRHKQLDDFAARLRAERAELDEALKNIKKIQQQVDRDVFRIKEDEAGNLKKLAKMYAAMEPAGAARILRELDDVVLVKLFALMKEPEAAPVLEAFARLGEPEIKRAALISEHLRANPPAKGGAK